MKYIYLSIFIIVLFTSCNNSFQYDQTNPVEVIKYYNEQKDKNDFSSAYELLSKESKKIVSKEEYINYYEKKADNSAFKYVILKLNKVESNPELTNYQRVRLYEYQLENNIDTTYYILYYTLKNENGNWKVLWTSNLEDEFSNKFNDGDYTGCINLCNKVIEINPYNTNAYSEIGWSYYYDNTTGFEESQSEMLNAFKYCIAIEPDISDHYNSLAIYYYYQGIKELEIESYNKAIANCLNEKSKATYYGNMSLSYYSMDKYDKALQVAKLAIQYDSTDYYGWYQYAKSLSAKNKFAEADKCFKKSLDFSIESNHQKAYLLYYYALNLYKMKEYKKAKENILQALELEPDFREAIELYKKINYYS